MRSRLPTALAVLLLGSPVLGADGPIAHWTMDGVVDGRVPDVTGNGHDATLGPEGCEQPAVVDGVVGKALRFDPEQGHFLTVAQSGDFNFQGPFTVMAWIQVTAMLEMWQIPSMLPHTRPRSRSVRRLR